MSFPALSCSVSVRSAPPHTTLSGYPDRSGRRLFIVRETVREWAGADRLDDDRLDDLADEITTLAAHIHAATARLLELIAEFDRCRGWAREGHRSCAHWLAFRTGIALGAAREKVRAAGALVDLPEIAAAMACGELSFSKVRALTRVASPGTESDLLELARGCTTAHTERMVRAWKKYDGVDEADVERELHASRTLSVFPDDEGMYVVRGRLPAEVGALLMRAIEAASDAIFREDEVGRPHDGAVVAGPGAGHGPAADAIRDTSAAAGRRRADALALIAERAMAAGFGREGDRDTPISGTRAERYQVLLHVSAETLSAAHPADGYGSAALGDGGARSSVGDGCACGGQAPDRGSPTPDRTSHLEDGTRVSAETSRRLTCDAAVVRVTHAPHTGPVSPPSGEPLNVGRRTRTIPPALRRALELRDRGCRFPGCGLRFTDAHHIRHWAEGGETSLANCILLCRHHHRLLHEGGWSIRHTAASAAGQEAPAFVDPRGGVHWEGRWPPPTLPPEILEGASVAQAASEALEAANRRRGLDLGPLTPSARWRHDRDIPDPVRFAAIEALA